MKKKKSRSVDLNLFKVFSAVYSLRNLTHAGERLAMTQSAVSRAVDRLQHLFNERLFYRAEGEMRPTRTAEMLAPSILEGLALLESAINATADFDPAELDVTFKLGGNDYVSTVILPKLLPLIDQRAPSVFLAITPCNYMDAATLIQRDEIDCAITSSLPSGERIAAQPLFREDYVAISAVDHPFIKGDLSLDAYLACDHLLVSYTGRKDGWVDEKLAELGYQRNVIAAVPMFSAVPHLIVNKPHLCALPRRLAEHFARTYQIRVHELPFENQTQLFHLVWPRHQTNNPISAWLRSQIVESCKDFQAAPASLAA